MINEEDFNIIVYPKICHGQALLDHIRRTTSMLTVSLFRGTEKIQEKLIKNIPQSYPTARRLLSLTVIHEADENAGVLDPKVMLYQNIENPDHYWIRKESVQEVGNRTNYSEFQCEDTITALGSLERTTQLLLDDLLNERSADRVDQAAPPLEASSPNGVAKLAMGLHRGDVHRAHR